MNAGLDLDAYFARIAYTGPRAATLPVLRDLHALHPGAITFENLDVLLKKPIRLETAAIADKILTRGRGGYCYEQNTLLMAALQQLGFKTRTLAGRVQWNMGDIVTARNHMVLLVSLPGGDYIADVGFGGLTMTAPLRFEPGTEQPTPHGLYRIVHAGDEFQVQARLDGCWTAMYQLSLAAEAPSDWEMANWFVSTSPDSIFTTTLIVARPAGEHRYALRNNRFREYRADGTTEQRLIANADELVLVLRNEFKLNLPPSAELAGVISIAGFGRRPCLATHHRL
jgi:N-hydroxyarylamine O-acetyltransferase